MPKQRLAKPASVVDRIAQALAEADGEAADADPGRYRRLAIASLEPLVVPTEAMIDAAHEAAGSMLHGPSTIVATSGARFEP